MPFDDTFGKLSCLIFGFLLSPGGAEIVRCFDPSARISSSSSIDSITGVSLDSVHFDSMGWNSSSGTIIPYESTILSAISRCLSVLDTELD